MLNKNYLLPQDAMQILLQNIDAQDLSTEKLTIEQCYCRIVSSDIFSPEDLPSFPRSTVDGYAVRSEDTFGAKETNPVYLNLKSQEVFMGIETDFEIQISEVAKIPTGGMLPRGADGVAMLEYVQIISDNLIEVLRPVALNENVIQKGEDIKQNEILIKKGHRLRTQDIAALAGLGISKIDVFKKIRVSIISTGDEIIPHNKSLKLGQVRDTNSFTLWGLISENGGIPIKKGIFKDDYATIKNIIEQSILDSDIVLISGGTSAGAKDMTSQIINDIGLPGVLFHGVSLRPGKPLIGGFIKNKPVLGLPGHPAAISVCFNIFIKPLIEKLSGYDSNNYFPKTIKAKMKKSVSSVAGREDHIRVHIENINGKAVWAIPVLGKSGMITTLVHSDGLVIIEPNKLGLNVEEEVTVWLF